MNVHAAPARREGVSASATVRLRRWLPKVLAVLGALASACATSGHGPAGGPSSAGGGGGVSADRGEGLGPAAPAYLTTPGAHGAVGGPRALALSATIAAELARRGAVAQPDENLAVIAGLLLDRAGRRGNPSSVDVERIAWHVGFAGSILSASAFSLDDAASAASWREALAEIAPNLPVTRYGITVSDKAHAAAVVFGDVSVALAPMPRHLAPGNRLRLRGDLAPRFELGHVYVTHPDGTVRETPVARRHIDVEIALPDAGIYRVEIMGDGQATGPSIVMNVPFYVGTEVDDPNARAVSDGDSGPLSTAQFEARMLALLNRARVAAGLGALTADAELRAVALTHSEDMDRAHFFGHVSPTSGTVADRLQRAHVQVATVGENISQAGTPEESHQGLMDSPGHRANMLGARFTHVGIGVVRLAGSPPRFVATLVFARRPPAGEAWTATEAVAAIAALRRARGIAPVTIDPVLRTAAEVGMATFAQTPDPSAAAAAASSAFVRDVPSSRRGGGKRDVCAHFFEILDPDQLSSIAALTDPRLLRIGVAVRARVEGGAAKFAVLMLSEGAGCQR